MLSFASVKFLCCFLKLLLFSVNNVKNNNDINSLSQGVSSIACHIYDLYHTFCKNTLES